MHVHTLQNWQHSHEFLIKNEKGEKRTFYVLILTATTMVVEIIAGSVYGSMALIADGWHMGTHVAAFFIAIFAYRYARKNENNPAYTHCSYTFFRGVDLVMASGAREPAIIGD